VEARSPPTVRVVWCFCPPGLDPVVVAPLLVLLDFEGLALFVFRCC